MMRFEIYGIATGYNMLGGEVKHHEYKHSADSMAEALAWCEAQGWTASSHFYGDSLPLSVVAVTAGSFKVGDRISNVDEFGGVHAVYIDERQGDRVRVTTMNANLDGVFHHRRTYRVKSDERGEYIEDLWAGVVRPHELRTWVGGVEYEAN